MRLIVLFIALLFLGCAPKLTSNIQQKEIIYSDAYKDLADKGIIIGTFKNDSLSISPSSTLPTSTIFELGDLTQIFTAIGVHNLARDGEIVLNHSIKTYLPPELQISSLDNVTIQDCLSHLGGFPKIPNNIGAVQTSKDQPYENYTLEHLAAFLETWKPKSEKNYQYSLIGYTLLGIAFEEELRSAVTIDRSKIIQGHNRIGNEVPPLNTGIFVGAIGDALPFHFLHSLMMAWCTESQDAIKELSTFTAPTGLKYQTSIASAWHIYNVNKQYEFLLHKGTTSGHSVFIAICPQTKSGVVIAAPKKVNLGPLGMFVLGQLNNDWNQKVK